MEDFLELWTDHFTYVASFTSFNGYGRAGTSTALLDYFPLKLVELLDEYSVVSIQVLSQLTLSLRHLRLVLLAISAQLLLLLI